MTQQHDQAQQSAPVDAAVPPVWEVDWIWK
jgi:hypothetical protein